MLRGVERKREEKEGAFRVGERVRDSGRREV